MEMYSGIQPTEGLPVEPGTEWTVAGGETGLEAPMWVLSLGGATDSYPERPDEPDCIFFLKTGYCGYGNRCRFNHPRDRVPVMGTLNAGESDYPERIGQPVCQYYQRTGTCKYGVSCKYHHPKRVLGSSTPLTLNFYGYPLRPDEPECYYYLKNGQCKFGVTCKFHHPQPDGIQLPEADLGPGALAVPAPVYPTVQSSAQSSQQYGVIPGNWPVPPGSYVHGSYGRLILSPGIVSVPGWTPFPGSATPAASPSTQIQLSPAATAYTGALGGSRKEFPARPGQPECQYYMRTGHCKFGSSCKYHHPRDRSGSSTNFSLSLMGLPLRPGSPVCSHYAQNGVCKFGPSCKFDHPMGTLSYGSTALSLSDMAIPHYIPGFRTANLVPSSLTELVPGSSSTTGSMLSQPSIELSGQGSTSPGNDQAGSGQAVL